MNPTDLVDRSSLRSDVPDFGPGDTLKVHVRVVEGDPSPALRPLGDRPKATAFQVVREVPALLLLAVLLAFLIKTFAAQAFYIPSASMEPQLRRGDRVVVSKLSYDLHDVRRGDI